MRRQPARQPRDILEERPSWIIPAAIITAILILSGVFLYYYFGPTVNDLMDRTPRATSRTDTVKVQIDDVHFVVPANFTRFARGRARGRHDQIELHALLPDFEPFSEGNRDVFEGYSPSSPVIQFDIGEIDNLLDSKTRFNEIYRKYISNEEENAAEFGLRRYRFIPNSGYENQELFARVLKNGELFLILCERKSSLVPAPHCLRMTQIGDELALTYRYKRPYLKDWRRIESDVIELVQSFRVGADGEPIGKTPSLRLNPLD